MAASLPSKPSLIENKDMKFLICDAPNDDNLALYIEEFKNNGVKHVVRACEPTYDKSRLEQIGIGVHDVMFTDGGSPPDAVLDAWMKLVNETFANGNPNHDAIAVHCVAGLGRAPILVAVALIESGMHALHAVDFIRSKRKGVINAKQLMFLRSYKPRYNKKCVVM